MRWWLSVGVWTVDYVVGTVRVHGVRDIYFVTLHMSVHEHCRETNIYIEEVLCTQILKKKNKIAIIIFNNNNNNNNVDSNVVLKCKTTNKRD